MLGDSPILQGLRKLYNLSYCHYKPEVLPNFTDCPPSPSGAVVSRLALVCARPLHPREKRVMDSSSASPGHQSRPRKAPSPARPAAPCFSEPQAPCCPKFTLTGSQKLPAWLQAPRGACSLFPQSPEDRESLNCPSAVSQASDDPESLRAMCSTAGTPGPGPEDPLPLIEEKA